MTEKSRVFAVTELLGKIAWPIAALYLLQPVIPIVTAFVTELSKEVGKSEGVDITKDGIKITVRNEAIPRPPLQIVDVLPKLNSPAIEALMSLGDDTLGAPGDQTEVCVFSYDKNIRDFSDSIGMRGLAQAGLLKIDTRDYNPTADTYRCGPVSKSYKLGDIKIRTLNFEPNMRRVRDYYMNVLSTITFEKAKT